MKVGITLPQFALEPGPMLAAAVEAEQGGLDGVFLFDHLWPMGSPDRPVLAALPSLGAVAAATTSIRVGSLVMRVGLVPDRVMVEQMGDLNAVSAGRLVAGLGTGDRLSAAENHAYGIAYPPADERRESLHRCASELAAGGVEVWIGVGAAVAPATRLVAARIGAPVNVWNTGVAAVAGETELEVTWGGPVPGGRTAIETHLSAMAEAGASWVVCAWPDSITDVAAAARSVLGRP
ncbi:MAG TPA: LLM class flavin-dependent oxidoreductase [Acidimicrobiales bacterium]|nr:LLM class flavin-dependent oxidoreductase [Acidimicrobiales bacterium]